MNPNSVTYSTALLIAIICIIIGFAVGGFIGLSNKNRQKKKDDESTINPLVPAGSSLVDPAKYSELLRLWREKDGSGLFVETSGHLLASSEPLNERQKNRFIDLIKELADWLDIPVATFSEKISNPISTAVEIDSAPPLATQPVVPIQPQPQPVGSNKSAGEPVKTAPIPPPPPGNAILQHPVQVSVTPPQPTFNPLPKPPPPKPVVDPTKKGSGSMVEQIDAILQEVIENSEKPDRKIRLVEEFKVGVVVWVGNEHYIGIDAVPDPIVKDLIRTAVKEWDRRTETHP